VNFLQGIQYGKDPKHTQIVGTCKHFVANSMENWYNYSRHNYDAKVSKADLADYYFPAFKACVMEGKAMSIMCSCASEFTFPVLRATRHLGCAHHARSADCTLCQRLADNAVNGVPMCANTGMLNETLRNSWKFDGYVTSDW
jgi:beta-glucosidase-like glycosyl hydrolase